MIHYCAYCGNKILMQYADDGQPCYYASCSCVPWGPVMMVPFPLRKVPLTSRQIHEMCDKVSESAEETIREIQEGK